MPTKKHLQKIIRKKKAGGKRPKKQSKDKAIADKSMADMIWWSSKDQSIEVIAVKDNKVPWDLLEEDTQSKLCDNATAASDMSDNQSIASNITIATHVGFCCEMIYVVQDMYAFCRCSNSNVLNEDNLEKFAKDLEHMADEFVEQGPNVVVRWIR